MSGLCFRWKICAKGPFGPPWRIPWPQFNGPSQRRGGPKCPLGVKGGTCPLCPPLAARLASGTLLSTFTTRNTKWLHEIHVVCLLGPRHQRSRKMCPPPIFPHLGSPLLQISTHMRSASSNT